MTRVTLEKKYLLIKEPSLARSSDKLAILEVLIALPHSVLVNQLIVLATAQLRSRVFSGPLLPLPSYQISIYLTSLSAILVR